MKVLVVEDQAPIRAQMVQMLAQMQGYHCVGEASHGLDAIEKASNLKPDTVLLDIGMPGMNGLEVARHLSLLEPPPAVIFCTSFDHLALEAFQVNAHDYLLKPVQFMQLENALKKSSKPTRAILKRLQAQVQGPLPRQYISVQTGRGIELIALERVYYFLAEHKYTKVRHQKGESLINETLKHLQEEFGGQFIRIHRNALVARSQIVAIEQSLDGQHSVRLKHVAEPLAISRRMLGQVKEALL